MHHTLSIPRSATHRPRCLTIAQRQSIPPSSLASNHFCYTYNIIPLILPAFFAVSLSFVITTLTLAWWSPHTKAPSNPCHPLRLSPIDGITKEPAPRLAGLFACSNACPKDVSMGFILSFRTRPPRIASPVLGLPKPTPSQSIPDGQRLRHCSARR